MLRAAAASVCTNLFPPVAGGALLRFSLFSPLTISTAPRFFTSSLVPKAHKPILTNWASSVASRRRQWRASFSAGSSAASREILVQHLLVKEDDLKLLVELQKRVSEGEDLGDLAAEYSLCPSKEEGGMLGWVRKGQMVPEFEEASFGAPLNKVVRCKTKFGWHLVQVLSEREESVLKDIQPDELHVKMQDPSFIEEVQLIDVREPEEVERASLPGFQVFPLQQFGSWGPEITSKLDPQKDTYVLCHHGVRSLQVAKWLQTQGFSTIYNISGGIHAYAVKADPTVPTY
ncbi:rhodanese-like/PpiC domain-containing protein 12, chloroplastic [Daucus carota subsp. sativus]|uniref:rhodanese-like/PpiC domain-containing protein 12, chloroplastic n=1 Tax=Daucus carota subsp. sativus TaxID=79200 RepID=UPI0007EFC81B|nr:PREDICTED: rhodanese-like/PpiC domain-containing protein 12, chloroplastic isoform X1 [Daucus carota subsp. sativus]